MKHDRINVNCIRRNCECFYSTTKVRRGRKKLSYQLCGTGFLPPYSFANHNSGIVDILYILVG